MQRRGDTDLPIVLPMKKRTALVVTSSDAYPRRIPEYARMGHAGRGQRPCRGLGGSPRAARYAGSPDPSAGRHGSVRFRGANGQLSGGSGHQRTPGGRRLADRRAGTGRRFPGADRHPGFAGADIPGWGRPGARRERVQHGAGGSRRRIPFLPAVGTRFPVGCDLRRRRAQRDDQRMPRARDSF